MLYPTPVINCNGNNILSMQRRTLRQCINYILISYIKFVSCRVHSNRDKNEITPKKQSQCGTHSYLLLNEIVVPLEGN